MNHPTNETSNTARRLDSLERKNRRLTAALAVMVVSVGAMAAAQFIPEARAGEDGAYGAADSILTVRQIVIEDADGVVRARLGAALPNPVYDGKRISRGASDSKIAGLLLYDKTGAERGGYVTYDASDNVLLTLDAGRAGGYRQTAYFVADSTGATALRVWNGDGDQVELRAGTNGARFNAVEDGRLVFQTPEITDFEATEMCRELRGLRERVEMERLMDACRVRAPEEDCRLCLGAGRP